MRWHHFETIFWHNSNSQKNYLAGITCSKFTIETLEQGVRMFKVNNRHQNDVIAFIVNSEHISHIALVFQWLPLRRKCRLESFFIPLLKCFRNMPKCFNSYIKYRVPTSVIGLTYVMQYLSILLINFLFIYTR